MRQLLTSLLAAAAFVSTTAVIADDDRIEHFEGEPAETLEQAVTNFSEYNVKLAAILEKGDLDREDLGRIHQLTYTLENALAKIDEELGELSETLENLHIASEQAEYHQVDESGRKYLETARMVVD